MDETSDNSPYVSHIRAEHSRLQELLQRIKTDWQTAGAETPSTLRSVEELRQQLVGHFREEEEGGCLEEAVCRCPSLGGEADRIKREHPRMLAELDDIISHLRAEEGQSKADSELQQRFERFMRMVHAHDQAENRLLATAFGVEVE